MVTWEQVDRLASRLPEVARGTTRGLLAWKCRDKLFAWERPLRKADLEALGDRAPEGPILGVRVPDLWSKDALIAANPAVYFTTPHFDGYAAVLVQLDHIETDELEERLTEAWRTRAPKRLIREYDRTRPPEGSEDG